MLHQQGNINNLNHQSYDYFYERLWTNYLIGLKTRQTKFADWSPSPLQRNINCMNGQLHNWFVWLPLWSISPTTLHHRSGIWPQFETLGFHNFLTYSRFPFYFASKWCVSSWDLRRSRQSYKSYTPIFDFHLVNFFFSSFLLSFF